MNILSAFVDINIVSGNDVFDFRFRKPVPFCTKRFNVGNTVILSFRGDFRLESGQMQE